MLKSTMSLKEAKNVLGIQNITESSASKNGREFLFVSFTSQKTGEVVDCLVSEKAVADYKSDKFENLCLSEIWDDDTNSPSGLCSIHQVPANKQVKECAW